MVPNVLKDIRKVWSRMDSDLVRELASRNVTVGLVATTDAAYDAMEDFLAPPSDPDRDAILRSVRPAGGDYRRFDFVLCEPGTPVPRNGYLFDST